MSEFGPAAQARILVERQARERLQQRHDAQQDGATTSPETAQVSDSTMSKLIGRAGDLAMRATGRDVVT